jgi:hypothetical protein
VHHFWTSATDFGCDNIWGFCTYNRSTIPLNPFLPWVDNEPANFRCAALRIDTRMEKPKLEFVTKKCSDQLRYICEVCFKLIYYFFNLVINFFQSFWEGREIWNGNIMHQNVIGFHSQFAVVVMGPRQSNFPEIFLGTLSSHGLHIRSSFLLQREMTVEMEKRTYDCWLPHIELDFIPFLFPYTFNRLCRIIFFTTSCII